MQTTCKKIATNLSRVALPARQSDTLQLACYIPPMPYKPPRTLAESEELLKGAADHERVKGDWAFLGHGFLAFGGVALIIVAIVSIVVGFF